VHEVWFERDGEPLVVVAHRFDGLPATSPG
jgi:hypothetical protein